MGTTLLSGYWTEPIGISARVPSPTDLLAVARLLVDASIQPPRGDARLRRAVSTAYYALFHKVAEAAAQRFMGPVKEKVLVILCCTGVSTTFT